MRASVGASFDDHPDADISPRRYVLGQMHLIVDYSFVVRSSNLGSRCNKKFHHLRIAHSLDVVIELSRLRRLLSTFKFEVRGR